MTSVNTICLPLKRLQANENECSTITDNYMWFPYTLCWSAINGERSGNHLQVSEELLIRLDQTVEKKKPLVLPDSSGQNGLYGPKDIHKDTNYRTTPSLWSTTITFKKKNPITIKNKQ